MTDKEAFNACARGFTVGLGIFGVAVLFIDMLTPSNIETDKRFEIVDKYGDCNVVRYTDDTQRWHYFLDCSAQPQNK
jgi:hypothetical protein